MARPFSRNRSALAAGIVTLGLCALAIVMLPDAWSEVAREHAFDIVLTADRRLSGGPRGPVRR
jgi:hypothetical protein